MSIGFLHGVRGSSSQKKQPTPSHEPGVNNKCRCGKVIALRYDFCYGCFKMYRTKS